jgi:hypothetical protein
MLLDKLNLIVKYSIDPNDVKFLIDEEPVIDTINEKDKHALMMADMLIDEKSNIGADEIKNSKRVIYWKTSDEENAVSILGILWTDDKTPLIFKGHILPP